MALGRLGIHQSISSLSEASNLAQVLSQFYDQARRSLLAEWDWPFAKQAIPLAITGNVAPPPWVIEYARPTCLKVRSLYIASPLASGWGGTPITSGTASSNDFGASFGGIGGPAYQGTAQPYTPGDPSPTVIPFETGTSASSPLFVPTYNTVSVGGGGGDSGSGGGGGYIVTVQGPNQLVAGQISPVIWTNLANAGAWLTVDVQDPNAWEAGFVTAFSWHLAAEIAVSLTGSASVQEAMLNAKNAAMEKATNTEGNEGTVLVSWNAEWIDARDCGYSGWGFGGTGGYGDGS